MRSFLSLQPLLLGKGTGTETAESLKELDVIKQAHGMPHVSD